MNAVFLKKLLKHIKSLNKIQFNEYLSEEVELSWANAYLNREGAIDEFNELYFQETGKQLSFVTILNCLESEDLEWNKLKGIEFLGFIDAYGSCRFKFAGQEYYSFSNEDAGSLSDNHRLPDDYNVLTDCLIYSIADNQFYAFHVGYKDEHYRVFNLQKSDNKIDAWSLILGGELRGKRAYYWNVTDHNVNLRCSQEALNRINEASPEEYANNMSGTRLRINLYDYNLIPGVLR